MRSLNHILSELFQAHGVDATPEAEWVVFPGRDRRASAAVVQELPAPFGKTVQLDVRLEVGPGEIVVESFAGMGTTRDDAVQDAIRQFVANSFHVLLAAYFQVANEQVEQEQWEIGGSATRAVIGGIGVRGKPMISGEQLVAWFATFADKIKAKHLVPGNHWVRLYYAQHQRKASTCEVLLDNEPWEQMQSEMAAIDWPADDAFYSVRVFLALQVADGPEPTPERAVARLVTILAAQPDLSEDARDDAMAAAGFSVSISHRAFNFTQLAWGRVLLKGMPVTLSPDYFCLDAEGRVVESGHLEEERHFAAASQLVSRQVKSPAFQRLAIGSADVQALNNALHQGSKPEDLVMAPAVLFLDPPTPAGMQNAQHVINEQLALLPAKKPADFPQTKKWWRFWQ